MAYPLIILGAGASHDYVVGGKGLPTTDELIENDFLDFNISGRYKEVENIFSMVSPAIKLNKKGFEEQLDILKKQSKNSESIKTELFALELYLRDLFLKLSENFNSINNYKSLVGYIRNFSEGESCVINFNYDNFFEKSCEKEIGRINDYINNKIKIIKVHGSCDWTYIYRKSDTYNDDIKNEYDLMQKIEFPKNHVYHIREIKNYNEFFKIPAIAVPLLEKQNFICPNNHFEILKEQLGLVDRILIIGWSAKDSLLIDILKKNLKKFCKVTIVAGGSVFAQNVKKKLLHLDNLEFNVTDFGFSSFVADYDICRNFFRN